MEREIPEGIFVGETMGEIFYYPHLIPISNQASYFYEWHREVS
jgi:hypothetical protein